MGDNDCAFYPCDAVASQELRKLAGKYIKLNACYDNIYRLTLGRICSLQQHPSWRVAYGGVEVAEMDNLFAQHAFFLDTETGKAIDPTLACRDKGNGNTQEGLRYLVAVTYGLEEYAEVCLAYRTADSWNNKAIRQHITRLAQWCRENGYTLVG